ncbi:hypothetical protein L1887_23812 [Cichorium endivia]|nr:hypothetical protein L1887_23812 [Cichorium endivia]
MRSTTKVLALVDPTDLTRLPLFKSSQTSSVLKTATSNNPGTSCVPSADCLISNLFRISVGITNDGEASATRVVGTFGYLAPEYKGKMVIYLQHSKQVVTTSDTWLKLPIMTREERFGKH